MGVPRGLYITFYILYLIAIAAVLYFILHYSNVPMWVFWLFAASLILNFICLIIKETASRQIIKTDCSVVNGGSSRAWMWFNGFLHFVSFVLFIAGIAFTIIHSSIPWWPWVLIAVGILMSFISSILLYGTAQAGWRWASGVLGLVGLGAYVVGLIYVVILSKAPAWIWGLIAAVVLLGFATGTFEQLSEPHYMIIQEENKMIRKLPAGDFGEIPEQM